MKCKCFANEEKYKSDVSKGYIYSRENVFSLKFMKKRVFEWTVMSKCKIRLH